MQVAHSVPKSAGRNGLYETVFVATGRFWGGRCLAPPLDLTLTFNQVGKARRCDIFRQDC